MNSQNADAAELAKFNRLAAQWWDPEGEFKPLHAINPVRLQYIESRVGGLAGKRVVDVGCGGGILAESMAAKGADVTGIDLAEDALTAAREHAQTNSVKIDYQLIAAETLAAQVSKSGAGELFDVVSCMEMLEHVPDPTAVITACARLCKPGGQVFFSTINRHPKAFLLAIVGAEYLLKLLPRGTHSYEKFIKPSELATSAGRVGLEVMDISGIRYDALQGRHALSRDVTVNYLMHCNRTYQPL
ncbi:MAG TPA: bifunctional 2-polyprenyl-6-hydroxyphenol methylase/3-demethylubiquinol 3-O-methyltransferase UbiG [Gammaproteobacteria bacterium]